MRKVNTPVVIASILSLSLSATLIHAAVDGQNESAAIAIDNPQSSRMLLSKFMEEPLLHDVYLEKQLNSLTHPVDRAMRNFFLSDPRLEQIYRAILKNQEAFLQDFERYADVTMHRLSRGVTIPYDRLDHIVEETARDLGFSPDSIARRRIYIKEGSGSINAFTVSGSQEKIIVVVHSTLLEKMDEFEVRAVLGHELGHIRASHPVNGMLLDTMFTMILRTFTQGDISIPAPNERSIVNFSKLCSDGQMIGENGKTHGITMEYLDSMMGISFKNRRMNSFNNMVNGVVQVFSKIPQGERQKLLQNFLELTVNALDQMDAPDESVEFFRELSQQLPKAGLVKVDGKQLGEELGVVDEAISRAQESSADRFGSSISKNDYLASSMGKLLGIAFANENRAGVLKSLLKQAEEFYQNVSERERAYYMGGSHPVPVLRTHMIMNFSPTPDIFFANPFISLLILEDGAAEMAAMFASIPQDQKNKILAANGQKDPSIFMAKLLDDVDSAIVDHLMVTEKRIREGSRNPRFDNMLQFILINKENLFEHREQLKIHLQEAVQSKNQMEIKLLKMDIVDIDEHLVTIGQRILKKTRETIDQLLQTNLSEGKKRDLQQRRDQLNLTLSPLDSREKLAEMRALRIDLTKLPAIRTKGSRIPVECRLFTY